MEGFSQRKNTETHYFLSKNKKNLTPKIVHSLNSDFETFYIVKSCKATKNSYKLPCFIRTYSTKIKIIAATANTHCTSHIFITMDVSFIPLCSRRWWNGAIAKSFLLNTFFQKICNPLEQSSTINIPKITIKGTIIQNLILSK